MATGRSINKYARVYVDGFDLSGHARTIGPLSSIFQEGADDPMNAAIIGNLLGQATINPGTLNALFDNTAVTGIHSVLGTAGGQRTLMVAQGIQAAPAKGDPVFAGQFRQSSYQSTPGDTPVALMVKFSPTSSAAATLQYTNPWGVLLHSNGAELAASTDSGVDQLAESTWGGYMVYEVLAAAGAGNITATLKVQDSSTANDGDFGDLLSSGVINCGAGGVYVPTFGVVALGVTATVKQFVRWQVVLGTATSVTFVLSFHRNYI